MADTLAGLVRELATTGAGGAFDIADVPSGTYYLYAGKSGAFYSAFANDPVVVTAGTVKTVNLAIAPGAGVTARVTGPSGPVANATVRVLQNGNPTATRALTGPASDLRAAERGSGCRRSPRRGAPAARGAERTGASS